MYDVLLGGTDNFTAARQAAEQIPERDMVLVGKRAELIAHRTVQPDRRFAHTISIPRCMRSQLTAGRTRAVREAASMTAASARNATW